MTGSIERLSAALADRYRVERELGQGGMATVYLAHDRKHGRDVAVMVMHPDVCHSLGADRFLREIQLAARRSHPLTTWSTSFAEDGAATWMADGSIAFTAWSSTDAAAVRQVSGPGQEKPIGALGHVANVVSLSKDLTRATIMWREYRCDAWMYRVVKP